MQNAVKAYLTFL